MESPGTRATSAIAEFVVKSRWEECPNQQTGKTERKKETQKHKIKKKKNTMR
jgi:hypothetical protein